MAVGIQGTTRSVDCHVASKLQYRPVTCHRARTQSTPQMYSSLCLISTGFYSYRVSFLLLVFISKTMIKEDRVVSLPLRNRSSARCPEPHIAPDPRRFRVQLLFERVWRSSMETFWWNISHLVLLLASSAHSGGIVSSGKST